MVRCLVAVLAVAVVACDGGAAQDDGEDNTMAQRVRIQRGRKSGAAPVAPPAAPVLTARRVGPAPSFRARVDQYRKVYDLKPWIESFEVAFANGEPTNTEHDATPDFKGYSFLARELIGVGSVRWQSGPFDLSVPFDVAHEFGAQPSTVPNFIRDATLLGTAFSDWNQYPAGLYLPQGVQQRVRVRTTEAVKGAISDTFFFGAWRGYRLYTKGQVTPAQKTHAEYAAEGYELEPYPMKLTLNVATDGTETPGEILFAEDYLIDAISVRPNVAVSSADTAWGQTTPFVQLKIDPNDGLLMKDWVSLPLVGYHLRRTCWSFDEQPITVHAQTRWAVKTRVRVPGPYVGTPGPIDVVIYGSKLIPPTP